MGTSGRRDERAQRMWEITQHSVWEHVPAIKLAPSPVCSLPGAAGGGCLCLALREQCTLSLAQREKGKLFPQSPQCNWAYLQMSKLLPCLLKKASPCTSICKALGPSLHTFWALFPITERNRDLETSSCTAAALQCETRKRQIWFPEGGPGACRQWPAPPAACLHGSVQGSSKDWDRQTMGNHPAQIGLLYGSMQGTETTNPNETKLR